MGTSIKSKGSIHQNDGSARPGRKIHGAVTSAEGAMNGRFDNETGCGGSSKPYGQKRGMSGAKDSIYEEGAGNAGAAGSRNRTDTRSQF